MIFLSTCKQSCKIEHIDSDFIRIDNNAFRKCSNKSVDHAVMERTKNAVVVKLDANWSDVGSWELLWDEKSKDKDNNVTKGDVLLKKVNNSYIHSTNRLVAASDISDLVIIDTQDALLVSSKKKPQDKKISFKNLN